MRIEPCLFHSATLVSCATRCYPWSFFFCHHGDPLWAWGHVCSFVFAFSLKSFIQWVDQDYANFSPKMFFLAVTQIRASPGSHQEQKCICKSQIHDLNYMRWVSVRYMLVICYKENNTTKRERGNTKGEKMGGGCRVNQHPPVHYVGWMCLDRIHFLVEFPSPLLTTVISYILTIHKHFTCLKNHKVLPYLYKNHLHSLVFTHL